MNKLTNIKKMLKKTNPIKPNTNPILPPRVIPAFAARRGGARHSREGGNPELATEY